MTIDGDSLVVYNAPIARRKLGLAGIPGSGTVVGPAVSTDKAIARYDGATGTIIEDSIPLVEDDGRISTLTDPVNAQDAATKNYVDASVSGLGATYAPLIHATRHQSGGADPIKLDDLAAPDDNTDLNATAGAHGLLPKLSGNAAEFLDGTGGWSTPAGGGDVVGPASSIDDNVATFDGLTGKLIQDSLIPVTRFPSSDEKAALAGTNGSPSAANPYVTDSDPRNTNSRAPTAHASTHEDTGVDEIDVTGLSGLLADPQTVTVRKNSGANVGARTRLNFIEGSNVTLTVTDDAGDGEVDVTIAAATTTQKRGCVLAFCIAFTPLATGADRGELVVPYDPDDGTTALTWNVRRITLRVETAGGAPSVRVEKSTVSGAFSAATVGDVTLGSGDYEGSNTTALGTVASGNKLRMNIITLATAEYWTVSVELGEN